MNSLKILSITLAALIISCGGKSSDDDMRLYAVKYGASAYPMKYIYSYQPGGSKNFAWMFYLIRYKNKNILVDTGFSDAADIEKFKVTYTDPVPLLKQLDITPDDITDIIITHSHFDHTGDLPKYRNARIYIQREELDETMKNPVLKTWFDARMTDKAVTTFQNSYEFNDFIYIKKIGGHAAGSCSVKIAFEDKVIFLPGDEAYLPDNFIKNTPTGTSVNMAVSANYTYRLFKLLEVPGVEICTFHDPDLIKETGGIKLIYERK